MVTLNRYKIIFLWTRNILVLKGFSIYFIAGSLNKAIPFLLLPIITRYLSPTEFGIWAIYQVLISFIIPFIGLNSPINITRNFFKVECSEIAEIIGNLMIMVSALMTLTLLALSLLFLFIDSFLGIPQSWIYVLPVIGFVSMINQYNLVVLRNRECPKTYGGFEIGRTAINFGIAVYLIVVLEQGWESMVWGVLIANMIFSVLSVLNLKKNGYLIWNYNSKRITEILHISLPLLPHALSGMIISLSDRLFIDSMLGKSYVGLYAVAYTFGAIVYLFTESFNKAWSPWMYRQLADISPEKKVKIIKLTYLYYLAIVLLALLITALSYFLINTLFDVNYQTSKNYVLWIAVGMAIQGMYFMVFPYLVHIGKTQFIGLFTGLAALTNLLGNYILINANGVVGAAQSTAISYMVMFIGVWWYSNRVYPMPWFTLKT